MPVPQLAGDENGCFRWRDLIRHGDDPGGRFILEDELMGLVGDGGQHSGDEGGVGGQGHVFLGARADRIHRAARVGADAAGDNRRANPFARKRSDKQADIEHDVRHDEVGTATLPELRERELDSARMRHLGAFFDGDFRRCADLAAETAYDE